MLPSVAYSHQQAQLELRRLGRCAFQAHGYNALKSYSELQRVPHETRPPSCCVRRASNKLRMYSAFLLNREQVLCKRSLLVANMA